MRDTREGRRNLRGETSYQLRVTLMGTNPPIWRRLRVSGDTTLVRLDRIIQAAMGWTNVHLHLFTAGGVVYGEPSPEWDIEVRNERRVRLSGIAREEGEAFIYEYDLGDSWRHQVVVEQVRFRPGAVKGPSCIAGDRACPPEDAGGVHGYYAKLECLRNPEHREHEEIKAWMEGMTGGPFDPDAFDLGAVNRALRALR